MIFDLMATSGGGIKYFTKDGVIFSNLILEDHLLAQTNTWLTSENGYLKWRTDKGNESSVQVVLGVKNINLKPYKKIILNIPEYEGGYYNGVGISSGNGLNFYVLNSKSTEPPFNDLGDTLIKLYNIHPSQKYFEIDVSDINENNCQIWLEDCHFAGTEHVLYISEFGVK